MDRSKDVMGQQAGRPAQGHRPTAASAEKINSSLPPCVSLCSPGKDRMKGVGPERSCFPLEPHSAFSTKVVRTQKGTIQELLTKVRDELNGVTPPGHRQEYSNRAELQEL